jgi:UDP:flavonoid glycosyltransferase YjiC (YdhE family)
MFPVGGELQRRGHRVTIFSAPEAQIKAQAAGFNFCDIYSSSIGERGIQNQSAPAKAGKFAGLANIRHTLQKFAQIAETGLQKAPAIIKEKGVEALLVDLSVFEGGTIAEHLNLPYVNGSR